MPRRVTDSLPPWALKKAPSKSAEALPPLSIPQAEREGVKAAIRTLIVDRRIFVVSRRWEFGKKIVLFLSWFPREARADVGASLRTGLRVERVVRGSFDPCQPASWRLAIPAIAKAIAAGVRQPRK